MIKINFSLELAEKKSREQNKINECNYFYQGE
jgi:hypothetical protein